MVRNECIAMRLFLPRLTRLGETDSGACRTSCMFFCVRFLIIFLLMTLFIIFVATWLAFYLARGFVQPIEDLALATQRVSEGELGFQVKLQGPLDKDFALLMKSFNSMSRDLLEHQIALNKTTNNLQDSHRTLESQIRFVELVLENITTGVMSLDVEGHIEILNHSAKQMLQLKPGVGCGLLPQPEERDEPSTQQGQDEAVEIVVDGRCGYGR